MVTESDRDTALATLLIEQVETTPAAQPNPTNRARTSAQQGGRERWRVGVITGSVLVIVVALSVVVLTLARPVSSLIPAQTPASMPAPGEILAIFTSTNGLTQTRTIAANGVALRIDYSCTGEGQMSITVPRGPNLTANQCDGPVSVSSPTGLEGSVPITVAATGTAQWTVTIRAVKPNQRHP